MNNLGGGGQKKTGLYVYLENNLECFFSNINTHILGLVMSVEGTSKHQKRVTKHTLFHLCEVLEDLQLLKYHKLYSGSWGQVNLIKVCQEDLLL